MSGSYLFNITLPSREYFGASASPTDITLYAYVSGVFLSVFSGSYISDTSGSTISDYGLGESYHYDQFLQNITLNNNSYLSTGIDVYYDVTVSNYYQSVILNYWSDYMLSDIDDELLSSLETRYVG